LGKRQFTRIERVTRETSVNYAVGREARIKTSATAENVLTSLNFLCRVPRKNDRNFRKNVPAAGYVRVLYGERSLSNYKSEITSRPPRIYFDPRLYRNTRRSKYDRDILGTEDKSLLENFSKEFVSHETCVVNYNTRIFLNFDTRRLKTNGLLKFIICLVSFRDLFEPPSPGIRV